MAGIQPVSFTSPYAEQEEEIARRRRLAEALQAKGEMPMGPTETVGGWAIRKSPFEGLGRAAQQISGAYQDKKTDEMAKALRERQQGDVQSDMQAYIAALRGREAQPGGPQDTGGGDIVNMPAVEARQAGKLDPSIMGQLRSPQMQQTAFAQLLTQMQPKDPNAMLSKIDPKDYTPESFAAFVQSSDTTKLRPRVKQESVNLGGTTRFVDPYAPQQDMAHTMAPGETARLQQQQFEWSNLSPAQRAHLTNESIRTGVSVADLMFNTGQRPAGGAGVPGPASGPSMPQVGMAPTQNIGMPVNAPQRSQGAPVPRAAVAPQGAPVAQPGAAPGLPAPTGKSQQQIIVDLAKQRGEMEQKRAFNMGGIGDTIRAAEDILNGKSGNTPTGSIVGSMLDSAGRLVGTAPDGAAEADQLRAIGGALVAKMPRMEGPQSDRDVMLYKEMAGDIGNDTLPVSRRLAALTKVKELYGRYEHLNRGATPQGGGSPQVLRFDAQGNAIP